ncbi:uncharacterized protein [Amphiura filiformis]|uniref:uncharacterized protein n=1 Tax=Amphiura filiformis TaxID=82378 RepID=UPI003B2254B4
MSIGLVGIGNTRNIIKHSFNCEFTGDGGFLLTDDKYPPNDGRLEIYHNQLVWYTVRRCDESFDNNMNKVICRQLGFGHASTSSGGVTPVSNEENPFVDKEVKCIGNETQLIECFDFAKSIDTSQCESNAIKIFCSWTTTDKVSDVLDKIEEITDPGQPTNASATWTDPVVPDISRGFFTITSDYESGYRFPIGDTLVTVQAMDSVGNCDTRSFTVTVTDEEKPDFDGSFPETVRREIPCTQGSDIINWTVPSVSDNSGSYTLSSNYNPGDNFSLGDTRVIYTATDSSGNSVEKSFVVTVAATNYVYLYISMITDPGQAEARLDWTEPKLETHLDTYNLTIGFLGTDSFPIGVTNLIRTGSGACENVTFAYEITVTEEYDVERFEANVDYFEKKAGIGVEEFLNEWDNMSLLLSAKASDPLFVNTTSFVLKEFRFSETDEEVSLSNGNVKADVNLSPDILSYSSAIIIGILKSAHQSINLTNENVVDENATQIIASHEFGSPIYSVNLIDENGQSVPLAEGSRIEMTFDLLPEASMSANEDEIETKNKTPMCKFFNSDGKWSGDGCLEAKITESAVSCSCNHLTSFAVLMQVVDINIPQAHQDALHYLTIIGIAISTACLVATLVLFGYFKLYKKVRVIIHANLALSLLIGQLTFVCGVDANAKNACIAVTLMLHYFFLTVFMWMLMEGVFLLIKMKPTMRWSMKPAVCISVAWGCPIPIVISTVASRYHHYGMNGICWLPITHGIVYAFVAPALAIALVNGCILFATMNTFLNLKTNKDKSQIERFRVSLRALLILEPLLGCTWVFGVLQFDAASAVVFGYIFVVCNTCQGVFIFICQCLMDDDISKELRKRFGKKRVSDNSSSGNSLVPSTSRDGGTSEVAM